MRHGNQHVSRKTRLLSLLRAARVYLWAGEVADARALLATFWRRHAKAPASTRRRWRCGH